MLKKRGLSPVIATLLLISIAIILAAIIFLWARSFVSEKLQKDLGYGPIAIETVCKDISFDVEATSTGCEDGGIFFEFINRGNVPIYDAEIRKKALGSIKSISPLNLKNSGQVLTSGQYASACLDSSFGLTSSDNLVIVPIIIGNKDDVSKSYNCDSASLEIQIS